MDEAGEGVAGRRGAREARRRQGGGTRIAVQGRDGGGGPSLAYGRALAADMLDTMYDAPGIGLAAIQVGVPKRVIVMPADAAQVKAFITEKCA